MFRTALAKVSHAIPSRAFLRTAPALREGYSFELTPEQQVRRLSSTDPCVIVPQMFDEASKKFSLNEIIPVAAHYDQTMEFPWPIIKKAQFVLLACLSRCRSMQRLGLHEQPHPRGVRRPRTRLPDLHHPG
jgi:hypothetical protein